MFQTRQGDLFFEEVKELPKEAKVRQSKVLAYGEVTGHSHTLVGDYVEVYEDADAVYHRGKGVSVVHEEHDKVDFPNDSWIKTTRQREYDPIAKEKERKVAD